MTKSMYKLLIAGSILLSTHTLMAQSSGTGAVRENGTQIGGNGTSGSYGSNHNPDSQDRKNNGTQVINGLKDTKTNAGTTKGGTPVSKTMAGSQSDKPTAGTPRTTGTNRTTRPADNKGATPQSGNR
jgi:hypothetical protein